MLLQLTVSGLQQGALYALVALSLTVLFRSTTIVNFGHGDFVLGGAFGVYVLVILAGLPFIPSAILAILVMFGFGMAISRGLIDPIKAGPHIGFAMMSISLGYIFRGTTRAIWGREVYPMPRVFDMEPIFIGNVVITGDAIVIITTVALLLTACAVVFFLTPIGKLTQAIYQSERGAMLIGINVRRFHDVMWGFALSLGAIGGILIAPVSLLHPDLGAAFLIRGFAAMTLGGFGSLGGAVVGGLTLGLAEQYAGAYIDTALTDITAYLVIVIVLLVKPNGLFGRKATVRM